MSRVERKAELQKPRTLKFKPTSYQPSEAQKEEELHMPGARSSRYESRSSGL